MLLGKQYCGGSWPSLGAPFQILPCLAIKNRSADYPGPVGEGMVSGDFASINGQPQRSRADAEVGGVSQADPKRLFVRLVTGDAIVASQEGDPLPRPTVTVSCVVTVSVQNARDDVVS